MPRRQIGIACSKRMVLVMAQFFMWCRRRACLLACPVLVGVYCGYYCGCDGLSWWMLLFSVGAAGHADMAAAEPPKISTSRVLCCAADAAHVGFANIVISACVANYGGDNGVVHLVGTRTVTAEV
jgi:hypothetical protein